MNTTDPIADLLTRVRNAQQAFHKSTEVPGSKMNLAVANRHRPEVHPGG
jgi:small subunit ribosomal protein S8